MDTTSDDMASSSADQRVDDPPVNNAASTSQPATPGSGSFHPSVSSAARPSISLDASTLRTPMYAFHSGSNSPYASSTPTTPSAALLDTDQDSNASHRVIRAPRSQRRRGVDSPSVPLPPPMTLPAVTNEPDSSYAAPPSPSSAQQRSVSFRPPPAHQFDSPGHDVREVAFRRVRLAFYSCLELLCEGDPMRELPVNTMVRGQEERAWRQVHAHENGYWRAMLRTESLLLRCDELWSLTDEEEAGALYGEDIFRSTLEKWLGLEVAVQHGKPMSWRLDMRAMLEQSLRECVGMIPRHDKLFYLDGHQLAAALELSIWRKACEDRDVVDAEEYRRRVEAMAQNLDEYCEYWSKPTLDEEGTLDGEMAFHQTLKETFGDQYDDKIYEITKRRRAESMVRDEYHENKSAADDMSPERIADFWNDFEGDSDFEWNGNASAGVYSDPEDPDSPNYIVSPESPPEFERGYDGPVQYVNDDESSYNLSDPPSSPQLGSAIPPIAIDSVVPPHDPDEYQGEFDDLYDVEPSVPERATTGGAHSSASTRDQENGERDEDRFTERVVRGDFNSASPDRGVFDSIETPAIHDEDQDDITKSEGFNEPSSSAGPSDRASWEEENLDFYGLSISDSNTMEGFESQQPAQSGQVVLSEPHGEDEDMENNGANGVLSGELSPISLSAPVQDDITMSDVRPPFNPPTLNLPGLNLGSAGRTSFEPLGESRVISPTSPISPLTGTSITFGQPAFSTLLPGPSVSGSSPHPLPLAITVSPPREATPSIEVTMLEHEEHKLADEPTAVAVERSALMVYQQPRTPEEEMIDAWAPQEGGTPVLEQTPTSQSPVTSPIIEDGSAVETTPETAPIATPQVVEGASGVETEPSSLRENALPVQPDPSITDEQATFAAGESIAMPEEEPVVAALEAPAVIAQQTATVPVVGQPMTEIEERSLVVVKEPDVVHEEQPEASNSAAPVSPAQIDSVFPLSPSRMDRPAIWALRDPESSRKESSVPKTSTSPKSPTPAVTSTSASQNSITTYAGVSTSPLSPSTHQLAMSTISAQSTAPAATAIPDEVLTTIAAAFTEVKEEVTKLHGKVATRDKETAEILRRLSNVALENNAQAKTATEAVARQSEAHEKLQKQLLQLADQQFILQEWFKQQQDGLQTRVVPFADEREDISAQRQEVAAEMLRVEAERKALTQQTAAIIARENAVKAAEQKAAEKKRTTVVVTDRITTAPTKPMQESVSAIDRKENNDEDGLAAAIDAALDTQGAKAQVHRKEQSASFINLSITLPFLPELDLNSANRYGELCFTASKKCTGMTPEAMKQAEDKVLLTLKHLMQGRHPRASLSNKKLVFHAKALQQLLFFAEAVKSEIVFEDSIPAAIKAAVKTFVEEILSTQVFENNAWYSAQRVRNYFDCVCKIEALLLMPRALVDSETILSRLSSTDPPPEPDWMESFVGCYHLMQEYTALLHGMAETFSKKNESEVWQQLQRFADKQHERLFAAVEKVAYANKLWYDAECDKILYAHTTGEVFQWDTSSKSWDLFEVPQDNRFYTVTMEEINVGEER